MRESESEIDSSRQSFCHAICQRRAWIECIIYRVDFRGGRRISVELTVTLNKSTEEATGRNLNWEAAVTRDPETIGQERI